MAAPHGPFRPGPNPFPRDELLSLFLSTLVDEGVLVRLSDQRWTVADRHGRFVYRRKGEIPTVDVETLKRWGCWPPTRWTDLDALRS